jgi:peptidoglycan hydrolase CwlO-like protein
MDTGVAISIGAVLISFIGLVMTSRKATREDAGEMAQMQTLLSTINTGVTDIRVKIESMRDKQEELGREVSALKARVDILEGRATK